MMVHPSKVDTWLALALTMPPIAGVATLAAGLFDGDRTTAGIAGAILVLVVAIYRGLVFPLRYEIGDGRLVVRAGLTRSAIDLAAIRGVTPSRNPLSAPALSLDRLHVEHGTTFGTLISPRDRGAFLDDLALLEP